MRQQATTTNNVVTYEVVISAPNKDLKLKPGLTASVTIFTAERQGVLSVPSKALRFTPTKETVGKMKIIDSNGKTKVWTIDGMNIRAIPVSTGMTDGIHTQITKGLQEGQEIITEIKVVENEEMPQAGNNERSPFAPGPRNRNRSNNKR